MKLEHEFTVPAPVDEAWKVLLDVERVAPCMPGATLLTVDGDQFTGTVKVKVGPIQVTYKGEAKFASLDESGHTAIIEATGKEARGSGTAAAIVTAVLVDAGGSTTNVKVETELDVTGRPAQFGRGVMAEVAAKLIGQFSNCLAAELASPSGASSAPPAAAPPAAPAKESAPAKPTPAESSPPKPSAPKPGPPPRAAEPVQPAAAPLPPTSTAASEPAPAPVTPLPQESRAQESKAQESKAQPAPSTSTSSGSTSSSGPRQVPPPARPAEPIDLLEVAGGSVGKRLAPIAAGLVALLLFIVWRRRRS